MGVCESITLIWPIICLLVSHYKSCSASSQTEQCLWTWRRLQLNLSAHIQESIISCFCGKSIYHMLSRWMYLPREWITTHVYICVHLGNKNQITARGEKTCSQFSESELHSEGFNMLAVSVWADHLVSVICYPAGWDRIRPSINHPSMSGWLEVLTEDKAEQTPGWRLEVQHDRTKQAL